MAVNPAASGGTPEITGAIRQAAQCADFPMPRPPITAFFTTRPVGHGALARSMEADAAF